MVCFSHGALVIVLLAPTFGFPEIKFLCNGGCLWPLSGHGAALFLVSVRTIPTQASNIFKVGLELRSALLGAQNDKHCKSNYLVRYISELEVWPQEGWHSRCWLG